MYAWPESNFFVKNDNIVAHGELVARPPELPIPSYYYSNIRQYFNVIIVLMVRRLMVVPVCSEWVLYDSGSLSAEWTVINLTSGRAYCNRFIFFADSAEGTCSFFRDCFGRKPRAKSNVQNVREKTSRILHTYCTRYLRICCRPDVLGNPNDARIFVSGKTRTHDEYSFFFLYTERFDFDFFHPAGSHRPDV